MPVERREQATRVGLIYGSTAGRMNPVGFGGRRQPSVGGTSRISREAYVRFCERLGVKFPGPTRHVVGEINEGWKVTVANLMYERTSIAAVTPVERRVDELIKLLRSVQFAGIPATQHPYVRQKVAQFAAEARCMKFGRYRALTSQVRGRVPGPESSFRKLLFDLGASQSLL